VTTRLDRIENEAREIGKYMEMAGGVNGTGVGDILALVAVARAADGLRAEASDSADSYESRWAALRAALAPLLAPVGEAKSGDAL
jgi:hypothetical protein